MSKASYRATNTTAQNRSSNSSHMSVAQQGMKHLFNMAINSGSISKELSKNERIQVAVSATNSIVEAGMGEVGVAVSIIHPLIDGELAHLGKLTIPAETQAFAQGALCEQAGLEAKYFGTIHTYNDI